MAEPSRYEVWIDRGGTFTDCIGRDPASGETRVVKVLSSNLAPIEGIRALLGLGADAKIPPCDVRMGTTLATNALLERKGAPVGLITNRGFEELLQIGTQVRPELFSLDIRRPESLYEAVVAVDARQNAEGRILVPLAPRALAEDLLRVREAGVRSLAVVLIHAHRDGALEREVAEVARGLDFEHVSLSHEVAAEMGMLGRGDTTVADAYLTPLIRDYVETLLERMPGSRLRIMQSSGGLTDARRFRGRDAVLSGPAGGVVAAARVGEEVGVHRLVGFDMGGTSTDVCRVEGGFERVHEAEVAGVRVRAPMIAIHTVAAGGGSICRYAGGRFTVGPESAGAHPGPLCYGDPAAESLCLTDIAFSLGRVRAERFPFELRKAPVDVALAKICEELEREGIERDAEEVAEGFLRVAVSNMAAAIHEVSIARGHDVRGDAMVVFGGAGAQYACRIARRLGIRRLLLHPFGGVLSAFGMGIAPTTWHGARDAASLPLDARLPGALAPLFAELEAEGRRVLEEEGVGRDLPRAHPRVDLRYAGTETSLEVEAGSLEELRERFEGLHLKRFGYLRPEHPIEATTARVEVEARHTPPAIPRTTEPPAASAGRGRLHVDGAFRDVPMLHRESLATGEAVEGPALILEETSTIVVEPGFVATLDAGGTLLLEDRAETRKEAATDELDPVLLEIFNNLFMSIAEQMGSVLRRTALSTNIRDRLDFSCAVFDPEGGLVANAPHIPVHLGAMGESVRAVREAHPDPRPGDVYVTNDPAAGGSHLPDITVVTPVHDDSGVLRFYTASRGHHADVGGITPGSMPPFSERLEQEGVVFRTLRMVREGKLDHESISRVLEGGAHPARRPKENVADLEAQVAANHRGALLLDELTRRFGRDVVLAYMGHVQENAARCVEDAIDALPDGERGFEDFLDDGSRIHVKVRIEGRAMSVDFSGTDAEVPGNLNAPRAVTIAAVLYVLRTMVGTPIPLNSGCLRPVEIVIAPGSLLDPGPERAVAGGNVETSQRIVDVLLGALGRVAASQGTMNNLTFGDDSFGYYETLGGGAGAGESFDGASGVHTHMTNSRITDPEILEARFPVRLRSFAIRRGSGGAGLHRGGDGLVREFEFLAPMTVALLSERRVRRPYGVHGGEPGAAGRNLLDGRDIGGRATVRAPAGAILRIETPGGGGWGEPEAGS